MSQEYSAHAGAYIETAEPETAGSEITAPEIAEPEHSAPAVQPTAENNDPKPVINGIPWDEWQEMCSQISEEDYRQIWETVQSWRPNPQPYYRD